MVSTLRRRWDPFEKRVPGVGDKIEQLTRVMWFSKIPKREGICFYMAICHEQFLMSGVRIKNNSNLIEQIHDNEWPRIDCESFTSGWRFWESFASEIRMLDEPSAVTKVG